MSHTTTIFDTLIDLCDDIAWARPANEDKLFALTADPSISDQHQKLAEAFGLMLVKIDAREYERNQIIAELTQRNKELEEARKLLSERHANLALTMQETQQRSLVGQCEAIENVRHMALSIARRPINTLVLGPTGAGKEVIAKLIHFSSPRREGPFVAVNCTAIPDSLFESEMFGIEKGVATGVTARKGLVEEAHGGTLFLDELADMTLTNQSKLLRVLESRELMRVGSNKAIPVDIKIIAATNVNLIKAIENGSFREDLYYRINVAEVRLPPLCERGEDILLLARKFLDQHCSIMGRGRLTLSLEARQCLLAHPWPGNVRELNNEMERATALTIGDMVDIKHLSPRLQKAMTKRHKEAQEASLPTNKLASDMVRQLASSITAAQHKIHSLQQRPMVHSADESANIVGAEKLQDPTSLAQLETSPSLASPVKKDTANVAQQASPALTTYNLQSAERELVVSALHEANGNKSRAADLLGITREGLRKKLLRMGLE
ncbi:MAG: sigma 54-interacting transcriptional regulator [Pseudomonadota bacterium]